MPYKEPDPTDPNMLVGVVLPADAEATRDMAYVFAEEFARMGYNTAQVLSLFKTPFYAGAHGAYRDLGEAEIWAIISECFDVWSKLRVVIKDEGERIKAEKNDSYFIPHPSSFKREESEDG